MILHLFDDEKIVNRVIDIFNEALPNENIFVCFLNGEKSELVKCQESLYFYNGYEELDIDYTKIDKVAIHFLHSRKIQFCNKYVPRQASVFWFMWGADLYNALLVYRGYKLNYSRRFYSFINNLRYLAGRLGYIGNEEKTTLEFISDRVNYFVSDCEEEYRLLRRYLPQQTQNLELRNLFYYPIEQILNWQLMGIWSKGNRILLGNSASFTNNHIYVLKILARLSLENKMVIAPISYGGSTEYKEYIKEVGSKLLGEKFKPLEKFLPLDEYNHLMSSAEICIFGSWRQEAVGNIVIALYLGAKVFLSRHSPLLCWYRKMGITIFELEFINSKSISEPLPLALKKKNREILRNRYNKDRLIHLIQVNFGKYRQ